jgi:hypothetical protein
MRCVWGFSGFLVIAICAIAAGALRLIERIVNTSEQHDWCCIDGLTLDDADTYSYGNQASISTVAHIFHLGADALRGFSCRNR